MGNIISPPKETIVLIPPRISTRGLTRPIELENPMSVSFGNLFRREVLYDLHNFEGSVALDVLMAPETPATLAAHLSMIGSVAGKKVTGGSLNLHLDSPLGEDMHAAGRLTLGNGSGVTGYGIISKEFHSGRISLTGSILDASKVLVGVRGSSGGLSMGAEGPASDPVEATAWAISRVENMFSVGVKGKPFKADASVEISASIEKKIPNSDSSYAVSVTMPNLPSSGEVSVGFTQHLVTHRKVYNPFEDKRVKYIANYVDIAVEGTSEGGVAGGVSWQPNKNVLTKLHVSTARGAVASLAVRNWWVPSVLASFSAGINAQGSPFLGLKLQLSNWVYSPVQYSTGTSVNDLPARSKWTSVRDLSALDPENRLV